MPRPQIDGKATIAFIEHCRDSTIPVEQFVLVSALGVATPLKFPYLAFNLLGGLLFWKKRAEDALRVSGIPFTVVRPGVMERVTDSWGRDHHLVLKGSGEAGEGVVSRLQVAELIAAAVNSREASANKVVEVVTAEGSLNQDLAELWGLVPASGPTIEQQKQAQEARTSLVQRAEQLDAELDDAEKTIESAR